MTKIKNHILEKLKQNRNEEISIAVKEKLKWRLEDLEIIYGEKTEINGQISLK